MPVIETPALWTPSYSQGFARNQSKPANPGLWRGLVGLWDPSLGPTGATLFEQTGRAGDGTLTDMDPGTDWTIGEGGYQIDLDGAADRIVASAPILPDPNILTFVSYVKSPDTGVWQTIFGREGAAATAPKLEFRGNDTVQIVTDIFACVTNVGYIFDNTWHLIIYRKWGDQIGEQEFWIDGKLATLDSDLASTFTNDASLVFGRRSAGSLQLTGSLGLQAWYSRAITVNEIQTLHRDHHAIVRPLQRITIAEDLVGPGPPAGAIMNQMQGSNLGADLFDGVLIG